MSRSSAFTRTVHPNASRTVTDAAALGLTEHHQLGIVDGTCAAQPHGAIVRHLARIVSLVAPDMVVAFGPDGMTGHEAAYFPFGLRSRRDGN